MLNVGIRQMTTGLIYQMRPLSTMPSNNFISLTI